MPDGKMVSFFDSGCDISVLGHGWMIVTDLNELIYCKGPFLVTGSDNETACRLVNAMTMFEFTGTSFPPILVQCNCGLVTENPGQFESLISTSQLMHNEVAVNMVPLVYPHRNCCPWQWYSRNDSCRH